MTKHFWQFDIDILCANFLHDASLMTQYRMSRSILSAPCPHPWPTTRLSCCVIPFQQVEKTHRENLMLIKCFPFNLIVPKRKMLGNGMTLVMSIAVFRFIHFSWKTNMCLLPKVGNAVSDIYVVIYSLAGSVGTYLIFGMFCGLPIALVPVPGLKQAGRDMQSWAPWHGIFVSQMSSKRFIFLCCVKHWGNRIEPIAKQHPANL